MPPKLVRRIGIAAAAALLGLVLAEAALRVVGFEFAMRPESIDFGGPTRDYFRTSFAQDPDVFWVHHRYGADLERLRRTRPRIVFMGDSCTQLGRYDEAFAKRVGTTATGEPLAYGNLGVTGWSSWQGRLQLERDVLPLRPRVVTLYFGWNDHWTGFGIEDKNVSRLKDLSSPFLESLRLGQLLIKLRIAREIGAADRPNRVSEDDFRANLAAMVRSARAAGVEAVLVTAPTAHVDGGTLPGPMERWLRRPEDLVPVHRRYAEIVREVARAEGAPLCDLEAAMRRPAADGAAAWFTADGIHLSPAGAEFVGELLHRDLVRAGLVARLTE